MKGQMAALFCSFALCMLGFALFTRVWFKEKFSRKATCALLMMAAGAVAMRLG